MLARLPDSVAERELRVLQNALGLRPEHGRIERHEAASPGNVVMVLIRHAHGVELVSVLGEKGRPAEDVAAQAARQARAFLDAGAPVGEYLADQLLLPLALGAGGSFVTGALSGHTRTNMATIALFLGDCIAVEPLAGGRNRVVVRPRG